MNKNIKPYHLRWWIHSLVVAVCCGITGVWADIVIPGADGSDGALVTATGSGSTTIDLSQARTGTWDSPGNGDGVYDPAKWAVVFKYSSIDLSGGDLFFTNHPSNAPVVWLVSGDVNIRGTVRLESTSGVTTGPGGFRGGGRTGAGFGPGGRDTATFGVGGGYATPGTDGTNDRTATYGNTYILPLIGGSGGFIGGGGAILIAAQGTITLSGTIRAYSNLNIVQGALYNGSGGAVRLIADTIEGSGFIDVLGRGFGGDGYIRLEAYTPSNALRTSPVANTVEPDTPPLIWPPANAPTVRVEKIDTISVIAPTGDLSLTDVTLNEVSQGDIILETTQVESNATVTVRLAPVIGEAATFTATYISGDLSRSTWIATVDFPEGIFVVYARAERN